MSVHVKYMNTADHRTKMYEYFEGVGQECREQN